MTTGRAFGTRLANVPVLVAEPQCAPRGAVLWFHGFRADALAHAVELERCASLGFLAVGVDAVEHGARATGALDARLASSTGGALPVMLDLVERAIDELPRVIDALDAEYGVGSDRLSVVGISMGAFLVYRALARGFRFRAAVALLGTPEWRADAGLPSPPSPHTAIDAMRRAALLSVVAEHDERVSPAGARRLHATLAALYGGRATHRYLELRGSGHLTSSAHWSLAMDATTEWLTHHG